MVNDVSEVLEHVEHVSDVSDGKELSPFYDEYDDADMTLYSRDNLPRANQLVAWREQHSKQRA